MRSALGQVRRDVGAVERAVAEEEFSAWLAALKDRYPVEINQAALDAKQ